MFGLYLLLALLTSCSLYAADTDEASTALIIDTAQTIPDTVFLPEGLVTIASSQKDRPKTNGCFFTKKRVAFLTVLRLSNPSKEGPEENNRRLDKVHAFLEEGVKKDLPKHCSGCLYGSKYHCNGEWGGYYKCLDCNRTLWNSTGKPSFQDQAREALITTAVQHCNNTLWQELSKDIASGDFIEHLAAYKVIGSLYLLSGKKCFQQALVEKISAKGSPSGGKLPCELGGSLNAESRYIATTKPELNPTERNQFIFEPLQNNLGSIDYIAQAILGYIDKKEPSTQGADVVIIDRDRLRQLIARYYLQSKKTEEKEGCCTLS